MLHFLSLKHRSVPILEGYGVGIDFILCRNNKVCHDVCECLVPAGEGVARAGRVGGCFCVAAVLHFLSLKHRSVPVLEGYGVGIDFILCRDNKVCRDVCECLVPAGEGVPNASRVGGCFCIAAVLHFLSLKHRSVPVLKSYGVGIDFILCRDNEVCGNIGERLVPAGEGVARASRVGGCFCVAAVLHFLSLKHRSVPVLENYGVHFRLCGRNSDSAVLDSKLYGFTIIVVNVIVLIIVGYGYAVRAGSRIICNLKLKVDYYTVFSAVSRCGISPKQGLRILDYRTVQLSGK